ncbi:MAG: cytochrome c peroxidase [Alphaproteobacteria bacterium]
MPVFRRTSRRDGDGGEGCRTRENVFPLTPATARCSQRRLTADQTITVPRIAAALAAFERKLISRSAPYDAYLKGRSRAIARPVCAGNIIFMQHACADVPHRRAVHRRRRLSQKNRIAAFHDIGGPRGNDVGLAEITGDPRDAYKFRTPSLA